MFILQLFDKYTQLTGLIFYLLRYTMKISAIQLDLSNMKTFSTSKMSFFLRTLSTQMRTA